MDAVDGSNGCLLRIEQVAERLSVSRSMAWKIIDDGQLRSLRIGRVVRVRPQDLDAYLADPDEHRAILRHLLHLGGRVDYRPAGITLDRCDSPRVAHALELLSDELNATRRTCPAIADHWPTNWPSPEPQR